MDKKYSFLITLKKFLLGSGMVFVGILVSRRVNIAPEIVIPVFVGLGESIWNVVKFFNKRKKLTRKEIEKVAEDILKPINR